MFAGVVEIESGGGSKERETCFFAGCAEMMILGGGSKEMEICFFVGRTETVTSGGGAALVIGNILRNLSVDGGRYSFSDSLYLPRRTFDASDHFSLHHQSACA